MEKYKEEFNRIKDSINHLEKEYQDFMESLSDDEEPNESSIRHFSFKNVEEIEKYNTYPKLIKDSYTKLNDYSKKYIISHPEEKLLYNFLDFVDKNKTEDIDNVLLVKKYIDEYGYLFMNVVDIIKEIDGMINSFDLIQIELKLYDAWSEKTDKYFNK